MKESDSIYVISVLFNTKERGSEGRKVPSSTFRNKALRGRGKSSH
jgi:hypothetical protein